MQVLLVFGVSSSTKKFVGVSRLTSVGAIQTYCGWKMGIRLVHKSYPNCASINAKFEPNGFSDEYAVSQKLEVINVPPTNTRLKKNGNLT